MSHSLPSEFKNLAKDFPDVCTAFQKLGEQCHKSGPLDERTRRLVKLGIAIGTGSEGAVHSAVRNALTTGLSKEEIMHVCILSISTIGFPHAVAAMSWVKDLLESE
ncbi:MAG: carboxymuconolactone decarboxylase family protein [Candidatus Scalindua sp. AMX11]|nr:MAG: carboxymuconolactone decarboxylase family protein [Candidatus Scalindua sp.]NOG82676.1 carboxymuconolactone decarboxylase family protein [Planctomycetota bacterium]RZV95250.1 MAG: carboxymuconolactone decarboxylase family protein [Candidatus Scalindua sp. SCAELEC01]TDE66270.1 MAG: carboxymuconolactone decarboxylase family protein [Candidatus Scalindua sp. AMX11]GJQ57893.1 MAG: alkylhydroperoxidase [Candidatus Scalindua sp.]